VLDSGGGGGKFWIESANVGWENSNMYIFFYLANMYICAQWYLLV
jgi:hypothetical protein